MAIAVLFPGPGAQTPRIGEPWRLFPAWEIMEKPESALGQPHAHLLLGALSLADGSGPASARTYSFYEVGPGNVLTGLAMRTVDAAATPRSVTVPTDALLEVA